MSPSNSIKYHVRLSVGRFRLLIKLFDAEFWKERRNFCSCRTLGIYKP